MRTACHSDQGATSMVNAAARPDAGPRYGLSTAAPARQPTAPGATGLPRTSVSGLCPQVSAHTGPTLGTNPRVRRARTMHGPQEMGSVREADHAPVAGSGPLRVLVAEQSRLLAEALTYSLAKIGRAHV